MPWKIIMLNGETVPLELEDTKPDAIAQALREKDISADFFEVNYFQHTITLKEFRGDHEFVWVGVGHLMIFRKGAES